MPVYLDKNKKYYISTYVKDENGKSKKIVRRNKDWIGKNGKLLAQQEEMRLRNNKIINTTNVLLSELIDKKMKQDSSYLKQSSIIRYNEFINRYILPFFERKKIYDISTKDIIDWHNWLELKSIHIESRKKIHNLLASSLEFGIKYYGLQQNTAKIVGNFKNKRGVVKPQIQFLTYEEFKKFISEEESETYKDFMTLLFFTGMRRGELLAITFDDLDFENKTISINKSINPKNGVKATVPKTNKSNRIIPMVEEAYNILIKYKNLNSIFNLENIKLSTLTRKCKSNCKKAHINKNIRIHDFRHSFVALCIECNIQIEKISEYVGHENISTTYDVYSHLYPNATNELVSKLNIFLQNSIKNSIK